MGRDSFLSFRIGASLDSKLAHHIVNKGKMLGCVYLRDKYANALQSNDLLSTTEAINRLLQGFEYLNSLTGVTLGDFRRNPQLCVRKDGIIFDLFFGKEGEYCYVMLNHSIYVWYLHNDDRGGYKYCYLDWERYLLFMFALCKGLPIIRVNTYDSYYDEDEEYK